MSAKRPRRRGPWDAFIFLIKYAFVKEFTTPLGRLNLGLTALLAVVALASNFIAGSLRVDATAERTIVTVTGTDMGGAFVVMVVAFVICLGAVGGLDYFRDTRRK